MTASAIEGYARFPGKESRRLLLPKHSGVGHGFGIRGRLEILVRAERPRYGVAEVGRRRLDDLACGQDEKGAGLPGIPQRKLGVLLLTCRPIPVFCNLGIAPRDGLPYRLRVAG